MATGQHESAIPVRVANAVETVLLMAGACAIPVLTNCLVAATLCLVLVRAIVAGMTARAIRLEGRELPGNDFAVVLMTIGAIQITAVIQRFERRRQMAKIVRRK